MNIYEMYKTNSAEILNEEEQLVAVKKNGYAIRYIHNPSEQVQLAAVNSNGYAIQHIHNPSEAVIILVKQS